MGDPLDRPARLPGHTPGTLNVSPAAIVAVREAFHRTGLWEDVAAAAIDVFIREAIEHTTAVNEAARDPRRRLLTRAQRRMAIAFLQSRLEYGTVQATDEAIIAKLDELGYYVDEAGALRAIPARPAKPEPTMLDRRERGIEPEPWVAPYREQQAPGR